MDIYSYDNQLENVTRATLGPTDSVAEVIGLKDFEKIQKIISSFCLPSIDAIRQLKGAAILRRVDAFPILVYPRLVCGTRLSIWGNDICTSLTSKPTALIIEGLAHQCAADLIQIELEWTQSSLNQPLPRGYSKSAVVFFCKPQLMSRDRTSSAGKSALEEIDISEIQIERLSEIELATSITYPGLTSNSYMYQKNIFELYSKAMGTQMETIVVATKDCSAFAISFFDSTTLNAQNAIVWVDPGQRGSGLGAALISEMTSRLKYRGAENIRSVVSLTNFASMATMLRAGHLPQRLVANKYFS